MLHLFLIPKDVLQSCILPSLTLSDVLSARIVNKTYHINFKGYHCTSTINANNVSSLLSYGFIISKIVNFDGQCHLPNTLTSLIFRNSFNKNLDVGFLPNSLTSLIFGRNFNQILQIGVIPPSVLSVQFGRSFTMNIKTLVDDLKLNPLCIVSKYGIRRASIDIKRTRITHVISEVQ